MVWLCLAAGRTVSVAGVITEMRGSVLGSQSELMFNMDEVTTNGRGKSQLLPNDRGYNCKCPPASPGFQVHEIPGAGYGAKERIHAMQTNRPQSQSLP
jgi:hypothetical protein